MSTRERVRTTTARVFSWNYQYTYANGTKVMIPGERVYSMIESCLDTTHNYKRDLGLRDCGGLLKISRKGYSSVWGEDYIPQIVGGKTVGRYCLRPGFMTGQSTTPPDVTPVSDASLWSLGAKAIAAVSPTNPSFSLATFLGELKEGLPRMLGHTLPQRAGIASKAGSEYLNYEFGWKPLIQDLRDLGRTVVESDKIRQQFIRDSGRSIQRRWDAPTISSHSVLYGPGIAWYEAGSGWTAQCTYSQATLERTWFEGAFRYFIPMGDSAEERWRRYSLLGRRMLGLSVSSLPETVWNLAPWSWLLDWHGDVGSVLTNIGNMGVDGLQLKWGYLMKERTNQGVLTQTAQVPKLGGGYRDGYCGYIYTNSSKQRTKASPFGFGLGEINYSPRQFAILAALGLSRDPNRG